MIDSFRGTYDFLSNFYPCIVFYKGIKFYSVENAFQAAKSQDENTRLKISKMQAGEAKKYAKTIALREDWQDIKKQVMYELLLQKFYYSYDLAVKLEILTKGQEIKEGNWWHDNFWGDCKCPNCSGEIGYNVLGKLLMKIRDEDLDKLKLKKEEFKQLLKITK